MPITFNKQPVKEWEKTRLTYMNIYAPNPPDDVIKPDYLIQMKFSDGIKVGETWEWSNGFNSGEVPLLGVGQAAIASGLVTQAEILAAVDVLRRVAYGYRIQTDQDLPQDAIFS